MAFKPSALKPPGAPLRAKQRNAFGDSEDADLSEASHSLDTPRKEGAQMILPRALSFIAWSGFLHAISNTILPPSALRT